MVGGKASRVREIHQQSRLVQELLKKDVKHKRQKNQIFLLRGNITQPLDLDCLGSKPTYTYPSGTLPLYASVPSSVIQA